MKNSKIDRRWLLAQGSGATVLPATLLWATAVFLRQKLSSPFTKILALLSSALWLLILYFFRDPHREPKPESGVVLGPADGQVVEFSYEPETRYLHGDVLRVSIFLSVFDVHVQRIPLDGLVALVEHQPGKFLPAFRPEASAENEYAAMVLETESGRILVKQIAGILARRCVNYMQPGDLVKGGQRFGLIRFGSRVDLFLPPQAQLLVRVGDRVRAGITPIARLK